MFPEVEHAVLIFIQRNRRAGINISGETIKANATIAHERLYKARVEARGDVYQPWEPSEGWVTRFKARHGIRDVKTSGESRSADTAAAVATRLGFRKKWVDELGFDARLIFNVDETGLFWRMLPDHTLALKADEKKVKG